MLTKFQRQKTTDCDPFIRTNFFIAYKISKQKTTDCDPFIRTSFFIACKISETWRGRNGANARLDVCLPSLCRRRTCVCYACVWACVCNVNCKCLPCTLVDMLCTNIQKRYCDLQKKQEFSTVFNGRFVPVYYWNSVGAISVD